MKELLMVVVLLALLAMLVVGMIKFIRRAKSRQPVKVRKRGTLARENPEFARIFGMKNRIR